MIDPQNDEERKALRLLEAYRKRVSSGMQGRRFVDDEQKECMLAVLAEARAILREEQKPSELNECTGSELYRVRDEIRLRSEVLRVFDADMNDVPNYAAAEVIEQMKRMLWLLARERELMGEEWNRG